MIIFYNFFITIWMNYNQKILIVISVENFIIALISLNPLLNSNFLIALTKDSLCFREVHFIACASKLNVLVFRVLPNFCKCLIGYNRSNKFAVKSAYRAR